MLENDMVLKEEDEILEKEIFDKIHKLEKDKTSQTFAGAK